jgi:hypothetical protein
MQQKIMIDQMKVKSKDENEKASLGIRAHEAQTKRIQAVADMSNAKAEIALQAEKDNTERMVHGIKLGISNKAADAQIAKQMVDSATNLINSNPIVPTNTNEAQVASQTEPQAQMIP